MHVSTHAVSVQRTLFAAAGLAIGCALGISPTSHAVVVDPAGYPDGTDISAATPGVTLSAPANPNSGSVFATESGGVAFFGYDNGIGGLDTGWSAARPLRADFTVPISSVSLNFVIDGGSGGSAQLLAFDATSTLIDTQIEAGPFSGYITSSAPGISYILASFPSFGQGHDYIGITELDFTPVAAPPVVPEAGTVLAGLGTLGIGLGGVYWRRRR